MNASGGNPTIIWRAYNTNEMRGRTVRINKNTMYYQSRKERYENNTKGPLFLGTYFWHADRRIDDKTPLIP